MFTSTVCTSSLASYKLNTMKGFVFSFTVILIVAKTGYCWKCPNSTRKFTFVGQRPVIPFSTNGRHNEEGTTDIDTFIITTYTGTTIFTINYDNGNISGTPYLNGCSLAPSADLANGVLSIELDTVQSSDWGTYRLTHNRIKFTVIQCVTLYVLGTPMTPSIIPLGTRNEGTSLSLTCSSTSTTKPSNHSLSMRYDWNRDGSNVTADNKFSFDSNLQNTLTISSLSRTEDNNRVLGCTATEDGGKSSHAMSYTISVLYGPDNLSLSPPSTSYMVTEGNTLMKITCDATCNPACTFMWSKSGTTISNTDTMDLGQMEKGNSGSYICTARNPESGVSRNGSVVNIIVKYAPDVKISQSISLWKENTPLDLVCKATGVPAVYNYTGFVQRIGEVVVPNSHIERPGVRDSISVNIPSLQLQDTGIYTCNVHNGVIGANKNLIQTASKRIDVQVSPKVLVEETTFAGETEGNLTISIPFVSVPEYTSYRVLKPDGQIISTNGKYALHTRNGSVYTKFYGRPVTLIGNVLRISITDLLQEDFGVYIIQITNSVNTTSFGINVTGTSKPWPPTELNLNTFDNVVTFEWKKGFNGGHEQTFVLQTSLNSDDSWMNITIIRESEAKYEKENGKFFVNLANLQPGMYRARLVVFNQLGAADPVAFKNGFVITEKPASSSGALIGAAAGGGGLVVTLIAVVAVVIFLKKRKTQKGHDGSNRLPKGQKGLENDNITDEVQNPMYVNADEVDVATADISPQPVEKKPKQKVDAGEIYAVVDKKKNKQGNNGKGDGVQMKEGIDTSDSKPMPVNNDGLLYADIVFSNQPKGQRERVANRIDDMTEYAELDITKHADPLPDSDNEQKLV